jgi:hypothetical protein
MTMRALLFMKARRRGDKQTADLFETPVQVSGYVNPQGTYVAPYTATRKKAPDKSESRPPMGWSIVNDDGEEMFWAESREDAWAWRQKYMNSTGISGHLKRGQKGRRKKAKLYDPNSSNPRALEAVMTGRGNGSPGAQSDTPHESTRIQWHHESQTPDGYRRTELPGGLVARLAGPLLGGRYTAYVFDPQTLATHGEKHDLENLTAAKKWVQQWVEVNPDARAAPAPQGPDEDDEPAPFTPGQKVETFGAQKHRKGPHTVPEVLPGGLRLRLRDPEGREFTAAISQVRPMSEPPPVPAAPSEPETPSWYTPLPKQGLDVLPEDSKSRWAAVRRIAEDAVLTLTRDQLLANLNMALYYRPTGEDNRHGVARLVPEDQRMPPGWERGSPDVIRPSMMERHHLVESLVTKLSSLPVLSPTQRSGGRADFAERREAHIERLRARAEKRRVEAAAAFDRAKKIGDMIPLGQPILVGHHSEKRHRSDIRKIDRSMRAGVEASKEAADLERRADAAESSSAVSSDDPDAVAKLQEKLAKLERQREQFVAINAALRRGDDAALAAMGLSESTIAKLKTPDGSVYGGRIGIPSYQLQNMGAEIRRLKARIDTMHRVDATPAGEWEGAAARVVDSPEANRVQVFFPGKPDEATRRQLKQAGFRWAPSEGAWQRQRSNAALYHAKRLAGVGDGAPPAAEPALPPAEELVTQPSAALGTMTDVGSLSLEEAERERSNLEAERQRQYWMFTRQARGQPVDPALTRRLAQVEDRIASLSGRVPESVRTRIAVSAAKLRAAAQSLEHARVLDGRPSAGGRYQAETAAGMDWSDLHTAYQRIEQFRALAREKGIDPEAVLRDVGGVPDVTLTDAAHRYLEDMGHAVPAWVGGRGLRKAARILLLKAG